MRGELQELSDICVTSHEGCSLPWFMATDGGEPRSPITRQRQHCHITHWEVPPLTPPPHLCVQPTLSRRTVLSSSRVACPCTVGGRYDLSLLPWPFNYPFIYRWVWAHGYFVFWVISQYCCIYLVAQLDSVVDIGSSPLQLSVSLQHTATIVCVVCVCSFYLCTISWLHITSSPVPFHAIFSHPARSVLSLRGTLGHEDWIEHRKPCYRARMAGAQWVFAIVAIVRAVVPGCPNNHAGGTQEGQGATLGLKEQN
jgi:hypothetical protein